MLDILNTLIAPYVADIAGAVATALIGYLVALVKARFGIEIEARHREALHSAMTTGMLLALSRLGVGASKTALTTAAVEYAKASVPDALKKLAPSDGVLADLAVSKLQSILSK